jgi:hypothetical protein
MLDETDGAGAGGVGCICTVWVVKIGLRWRETVVATLVWICLWPIPP